MSTFLEITSKDTLLEHIATLPPSTVFVLYFYTPWTAFCTQMTTDLSTLASHYPATTPPTISFISINGKQLLETSKDYGVSKAPCVIFLRDGEVLESIRGSNIIIVRKALDRHFGAGATPPPAQILDSKQENEALIARLEGLVNAAPIMLFMKGMPELPKCRFSRHLVGILREHCIDYNFFNVLGDEDVRQGLKEFANWPTFPQLWMNGELVGGLDIVREKISANPNFLRQHLVSKPIA